jgi:hypothetical protein
MATLEVAFDGEDESPCKNSLPSPPRSRKSTKINLMRDASFPVFEGDMP